MHPTPWTKPVSAQIWHGGRMHLVRACDRQPLKVPNTILATDIGHLHYLLVQQPAADWEHLHERPQLLVLLQQLRQILTYVRWSWGPHLRRHGPPGGEAGIRTVQAVHGGARRRGRGWATWVSIGTGGRGEGLCVYRRVSFSFLGAVAIPFFGKISAKP
uniref:Uncharacterized protein n=1 Tax=Arundo donax TaxID=35708 RepID=A0A0A9H712_ARUDO